MGEAKNSAARSGGAAAVKARITHYFNECRRQDTPATPAGLALALDMSTAELTGAALPEDARRAVERALLRIEQETLERALSGKGGAKGVEFVLGQTAQAGGADTLRSLSDEALRKRLEAVAEEIRRALEDEA